jgi:hypothetical protein
MSLILTQLTFIRISIRSDCLLYVPSRTSPSIICNDLSSSMHNRSQLFHWGSYSLSINKLKSILTIVNFYILGEEMELFSEFANAGLK